MNHHDEGMTLIELLISITLLTVVMAGITTAMLIVLDTTEGTKARISDSTGAQLLTSYFVSDVQSSDTVQTATPGICSVVSGGTLVVEMQWTGASDGLVTDVQYVLEPNADGTSRLSRYSFDGACGQKDETLIARNVSSVTCASPCTNSATQLRLDVTTLSKLAQDTNPGNYSQYSYSVVGYRRTK